MTQTSLPIITLAASMFLGALCGLYRGALARPAPIKVLVACLVAPMSVVLVALLAPSNPSSEPVANGPFVLGMLLALSVTFLLSLLLGLAFSAVARYIVISILQYTKQRL